MTSKRVESAAGPGSVSGRRGRGRLSAAVVLGLAAALASLVMSPLAPKAATAQDAPADQERLEEREMARRVMVDNCLICHSQQMVSGQKLTAAQWKAEVEKMIGWGSPVPPEQVAMLTEFLASEYPETKTALPPEHLTYRRAVEGVRALEQSVPSVSKAQLDQGAALYAKHCATCHGPTGRGADLGPNLVGISTLLRPAEYAVVVRDGRHRMPGFKMVLKREEERDILNWLRQQRYPEPKSAGG